MAKHDELNGSDFPLHVFPKQFQEVARETNVALGFPLDFIAGAMFFAAAVAIGNTHAARLKEDWIESPILYLAIVGKAGTNKSHPLSFALSPIFDHDATHARQFKQQYAEYKELQMLSPKECKEQNIEGAIQPPQLKKFVVSDVTPEGIAAIHEQNKRGICLYVDELKSWINNFNRYNKGSEEQFWLSNFSGKPIIIDRRNVDSSVHVRRSVISVIGTIQMLQLVDLAKGDKGCNGFIDRILFLIPRSLQKERWSMQDISPAISASWRATITNLINLECAVDENGDPIPNRLPFNADALSLLFEWQAKNSELANAEFDERVTGFYSKLETYALRFALIIQMLRWVYREADKTSIDIVSVEGAIAMAEYFRDTSQKVLDQIFGSEVDKLSEMQRRLYDSLSDTFTTAEGMSIAEQYGVAVRTLKRFISNPSLFRREKHGVYSKLL